MSGMNIFTNLFFAIGLEKFGPEVGDKILTAGNMAILDTGSNILGKFKSMQVYPLLYLV